MFGCSVIDVENGTLLQSKELTSVKSGAVDLIPVHHENIVNYLIGTSPDGYLQVFDISQQKIINQTKVGNAQAVYAIEGKQGEIYIANRLGQVTRIQPGDLDDWPLVTLDQSPTQMILSHDERLLSILLADGSIMLVDLATEKSLGRLVEFIDGSWAVLAADGRYDAENPGDTPGLSWVMADAPYIPRPIEIFMSEYYEPRLLPRLLSGEKFPPITAIEDLNRKQPEVEITSIQPEDLGDTVSVSVKVASLKLTQDENEEDTGQSMAIYNLRLFRDGQLVGVFPEKSGKIEIDPEKGGRVVVFKDIQLPTKAGNENITFTAYAFNKDRVKSSTARSVFTRSNPVEPRKRKAYIVSIGMNAYENPSWDLRYAANDALAVDSVVKSQLDASGKFDEVISIPLVSRYTTDALGNNVLDGVPVTAERVKAVFDRLSGTQGVNHHLLEAIPNSDELQPATPDDLLLITYSGHGLIDHEKEFHLFPYDIGNGNSRVVDDQLFQHTISSENLTQWLRYVDAGEILMVIDACNSAASVEGQGFRPGPMGSRGLGQLAYDKGMRILTASQAESVALESDQINHGALTYALVREGLESAQADNEPQDQQITASEWLHYAMARVPSLYSEIKSGTVKFAGRGTLIKMKQSGLEAEQEIVQQPGLFDFRKPLVEEGLFFSGK
jgi:uncharacterized caspase-like protein